MTRDQYTTLVLTWVGTPFRHQGRSKVHGCDCIGLVVGTLREAGFTPPDYLAYHKLPAAGLLESKLLEHLEVITRDEMLPGDIVLCRVAGVKEPCHVAIFCGDSTIHALSSQRKVVRHSANVGIHIHKIFRNKYLEA